MADATGQQGGPVKGPDPSRTFEVDIENTPIGPLKGTVKMIEPQKGKGPSPWVTELPKAVITLLTASVVGGLVSMAFNYKSWRENQRIDRAKIEMAQAQATYNLVNQMIAERIHRTILYFRDIEDEGRTPDTENDIAYRKAVETQYRQSVSDWNAKILLLIKQTEFDIDFAVKEHDGVQVDAVGELYGRLHKAVPTLNCARPLRLADQRVPPPGQDKVDWSKAFWVLAGVHNCFVEMSSEFTPKRETIMALASPAERRAALAEHRQRLDNLREHAMTYTHVASASLLAARRETQTRSFREYIKDW